MPEALIGLVGDVVVNRDDPMEAFSAMREVLRVPDILYGNVACAYSDRPHPPPGAALVVGGAAQNRAIYPGVGFKVVSMATNHVLDYGYEAMLETKEYLRAHGVKTCGAGSSEADSRQPAVVESGGLRVAFLGYASVFPMGYEATPNRPGLAPVREHHWWRDPWPNYNRPAQAPVLMTLTDHSDLRDLAADIKRAKDCADVVVTCFHWGDFTKPFYLTEHERRVARFCIDHGADMVIGHHHHALRGMEWYRGKPIMFGLGHFVLDARYNLTDEVAAAFSEEGHEDATYELGPRKGWPLLPMHKDTRMTVLAWARARPDGISEIGLLPCRIASDGRVHPELLESPVGSGVVSYLKKCNETQDLNGVFVSAGSIEIAGFKTLRVVPA